LGDDVIEVDKVEHAMAQTQEELACRVSGWVANLLAAERIAVNQLLAQHHDALLSQLDADIRGKAVSPGLCGELGGLNSPGNFTDGGNLKEHEADSYPANAVGTVVAAAGGSLKQNPIHGKDEDAGAGSEVDLMASKSAVSEDPSKKFFFTRLAENAVFETFFVCIILINTVFSAFQAQYRGLDVGYDLKYRGYDQSAEALWPGAADVFSGAGKVFAGLYTIELLIKLVGLHLKFFKDAWNLFDAFLVILWYLIEFNVIGNLINPMILRLCRLARLSRLIRHVAFFESFDSLFIIIKAIKSSFAVLIWACVILTTLLLICSLCLSSLMADYLEKPDGGETDKKLVYAYFGTLTRSIVSIFEISFASHVPVCRAVMENVGEGYALFFLAYKCVVGLSVFKVITGVFLHETFKVCTEDDELMVIQKKRTMKKHTIKMNKLFKKVDATGDGLLTWEEFESVLKNESVRTWLSAMDLDCRHPDRLWRLMDCGNGTLCAEELAKGVSRLKGLSKSADLNHVICELEDIRASVEGNHRVLHDHVSTMKSKAGNSQHDYSRLPPLDPAYLEACMQGAVNDKNKGVIAL